MVCHFVIEQPSIFQTRVGPLSLDLPQDVTSLHGVTKEGSVLAPTILSVPLIFCFKTVDRKKVPKRS